MKRLIFYILIAILLVSTAAADGNNLLANGGFEAVDASGIPADWYTVSYRDTDTNTLFTVTDEMAHSGNYSAKIVNANFNDARFVTYISVEPESVYRVSGYIYVPHMSDTGNGANFALENVSAVSECVFDSAGEWKYIEWYGETDTGQTEIEFGVRVGGYSAESKGTAYFDDITIEKVDTVPASVYADLWFRLDTGNEIAVVAEDAQPAPQKSTGLFILLGLIFIGAAFIAARYMLIERDGDPGGQKNGILLFALGILAAFILRLILAGTVYGYDVDIGCFSAWSMRMASVGPLHFYSDGYFCDYPPGYMLLLWPVGQIISAIGYSQSASVLIFVKIVPILSDMMIALLLYSFARKRTSEKTATFIGLFFALNPAVLVTGAAWGQVDSVLALFLLLVAVQAAEKKWHIAIPVYVLAILMKPQALLFGPVALAWLLVSMFLDKKEERKQQINQLWQGLLLAAGVALAVVLPFQIKQSDPLWLIQLYQKTLSSYNYAVLNTANLIYLLGGNWSALTAETGHTVKILSAWLPVGTGVLLFVFGLWKLRIKNGVAQINEPLKTLWQNMKRREAATDRQRQSMLSVLCVLFGLAFMISAFWTNTFLIYGTMWMVFVYAAVLILVVIDRRAEALPFYMALMLIGVYVLGLKIHERYLFSACALLPLAYIMTNDRRLLWLCAGLSVTTFINTAIVLDNSILFGAAMGHLNADTSAVNTLLCLANVLLCGYAGLIAFTGLRASEPWHMPGKYVLADKQAHMERLLHPKDARMHLKPRDILIMGVTFLVYSVVAFTNLGSLKAPQTAWISASSEDQVIFELEEENTFKLLYFAGVSYHNFTVSTSDDGETWSEKTICRMRQGLCYRWLYATPALKDDIYSEEFAVDNEANIIWFSGKYLRINAEFAGLNLREIVLRDKNGERIPVSLISYTHAEDALDSGTTPLNLIDEQDAISGEPGWFNGTYFDEIYHARTAYEHLHGQAPYETSHPPLGKLMMSVGVAAFGMTPFGWRFMGTLIGALMLPAMYLFGMQLTGKRKFASFAMLLLSLDLMHFTQTRIATIDSFPTFFIILSYLCMTRYILSDPFVLSAGKPRIMTKDYLRSLLPLLLSGIFIGCAIASKWTGLYAAVGLAILFIYGLYRQFRAGLTAYELDTNTLRQPERNRVLAVRQLLLKRIITTLVFCVLFFIAIPAVIYYLSYIPYLSPTGAVSLQRIIRAQQSMLAYHSTPGLGMDHPFYSPWWQWPLILKPMWYVKDSFVAPGYGANIICLGNQAVFYAGSLAIIAVFVLLIKKYIRIPGRQLTDSADHPALAILAISFLAQYLPWVLVPRSMFIYHYFASVPFIILATMMIAAYIKSDKLRDGLMIALLIAALGFFIMFYPYASGITVPRSYMQFLRWFPNLPV